MVAIRSHEADRFVRKPAAQIWLFLVCGPDAGLVSERSNALTRAFTNGNQDPFGLLRLGGDELAANPGRLADEANTIGLFGGSRCIHIDAGAKSFIPAIEGLIDNPPTDCAVVISAGDLKTDSPLRKLVSRYDRGAAIECYADGPKQLEELIDDEMKRAGVSITPGAREFLASHLGVDRLVTRSELQKLTLYATGQGSVNEQHVEAVIADAAAVNFDDAIFVAFLGDYRAATEAANRSLAQLDAGALIGFILRHVLFLHRLRCEIEQGASLDAISERLPRNYFGSKKTQFLQQLRTWKASALLQLASDVADSAASARRDPRSAERLAIRCLWWIVRGSRKSI